MADKNMAKDIGDILINFDDSELEGNLDEEHDELEAGDEDTGEQDELEAAEEEEEEETAPSDIETLRAQIAQQQDTINALIAGRKSEVEEDGTTAGDLTGENVPDIEVKWEDQNFVHEDLDPQYMTKEQLNDLLNKAAKIGATIGARSGAKNVLLSIPGIVRHSVGVQTSIESAVREFYSANDDLRQFKGAVATVAQDLAANNPDWSLQKLFSEAGKETRRKLGIKQGKIPKRNSPPSVKPRGQAGRKGAQLSGLEKEIGDMLQL